MTDNNAEKTLDYPPNTDQISPASIRSVKLPELLIRQDIKSNGRIKRRRSPSWVEAEAEGGGGGGSNHGSKSSSLGKKEKVALKLKPRERLLPKKRASFTHTVCVSLVYSTLVIYTLIILFGEFFLLPSNQRHWCHYARDDYNDGAGAGGAVFTPKSFHYENPDYNTNPCFHARTWYLLGMNQMECDFARRMFVSVLMGAAIGFERKAADRPAGIRTMSLVSLGACFFTMCGQMAFRSSTMGWDAARVSAAIPSGVGFLGAGLIWKGSTGVKGSPNERHEVHGLTTAASVWLSAAVGVGAGGRLYIVSVYAVVLVILVLRLGPRMYFAADDSSYCDDDDDDDDEEGEDLEWDSSDNIFSSGTDQDTGGESDMEDAKSMSREEQRRLLVEMTSQTAPSMEERDLTAATADEQQSLVNESIGSEALTEKTGSIRRRGTIASLERCVSMPELRVPELDGVALTRGRSDGTMLARSCVFEVPIKDHSSPDYKGGRKHRRRSHKRRSLSPRKSFKIATFHS